MTSDKIGNLEHCGCYMFCVYVNCLADLEHGDCYVIYGHVTCSVDLEIVMVMCLVFRFTCHLLLWFRCMAS